MSGHSKWATTKRAKSIVDAKRGAVFTKIGRLINIAARDKGGNPETNFSLRIAIDKAKAANMPKENIERAIKKGTGEIDGGRIEELLYEGIGPANSQFILKCITDNKNRSAAEIRHIFTKHGGSLGSVMWNFDQKGVIRINQEELTKNKIETDDFELKLIEAGADDILVEDEGITVYTKIEDLQKVKLFIEEKNIETESAGTEYVAKEEIEVSEDDKLKIEKMIDAMEEHEDISEYYNNINF